MNELQNKVITISAKEEKLQGGKPVMKIKDEKNLVYTVYKFKQDGNVSAAWSQLEKISVGQQLQIAFVEQQGDYEGKPVTYRTIRNFNTDIGGGLQITPLSTQKPRYEAPAKPQGQSGESRNWDKEAYAKCCSIWAAQDIINGGVEGAITNLENNHYWNLFIKIKEDSEKRFSPLAQAALKANPNFFPPKPTERPLTDEVIAEKIAAGEKAFEEIPELYGDNLMEGVPY